MPACDEAVIKSRWLCCWASSTNPLFLLLASHAAALRSIVSMSYKDLDVVDPDADKGHAGTAAKEGEVNELDVVRGAMGGWAVGG